MCCVLWEGQLGSSPGSLWGSKKPGYKARGTVDTVIIHILGTSVNQDTLFRPHIGGYMY